MERVTEWRYNVTDLTLNKSSERTALSQTNPGGGANAAELVGFDGSIQGGLRPFPGFRLFTTLSPTPDIVLSDNDAINPTDFFPVVVRTGDNDTATGIIYRLGNGDIKVKNIDGTLSSSAILASGTDITKQMSVAVYGRYVYIFVAGRAPILLFGGTLYTTGPGPRPTLYPADNNADPDPVAALQSLGGTNNGQIVLTYEVPSDVSAAQTDDSVRALDSGDYAFAYQLYDSRTGRRGPLSTVAPLQDSRWTVLTAAPYSYSPPFYAVLELIYETAKWDHVYIYRSVRTQSAGGTFSAATMFLDTFVELADIAAPSQAGVTAGHARALWWYTLQDKQLIYQERYRDFYDFDENMPFAGAGAFYDGQLFVSSIVDQDVPTDPFKKRLMGSIRWSSPEEPNPELFHPLSIYVPKNPTDQVLVFKQLGTNLIGWSQNRIYFIRREGDYVKVTELHEGYGVVGPRAVAVVGSTAYFITTKGLKAIDADGNLDDVRALDNLIVKEWQGGHSQCCLEYDPTLSVLFVLNPYAQSGGVGSGSNWVGRMALLWFNTGRVTELYDCPFVGAGLGFNSFVGDKNQAIFAANFNQVWITNQYRNYTLTGSLGGTPRQAMFVAGSTLQSQRYVHTLTGTVSNSLKYSPRVGNVATSRITCAAGGSPNFTGDMLTALKGNHIYFLDESASGVGAIKGQPYLVLDTGTSDLYVSPTLTNGASVAGLQISLLPVFCRWVGYQLGLLSDDGQNYNPSDFFRLRQVSAMAASFTDVIKPSYLQNYTAVDTYDAIALRGTSNEINHRTSPRNEDGTLVSAIADYEAEYAAAFTASNPSVIGRHGPSGSSLFVGIETFVSDVDYLLLEVQVRGKILGSQRRSLGANP